MDAQELDTTRTQSICSLFETSAWNFVIRSSWYVCACAFATYHPKEEKNTTHIQHLIFLYYVGCGKTLLVKALAASTKIPCLVVTPSVLLRKYVGDTNLQVRALFSLAHKLSPCIVCIDELDGLFRERSLQEHDVSRDLKTEFLQWWDGHRAV